MVSAGLRFDESMALEVWLSASYSLVLGSIGKESLSFDFGVSEAVFVASASSSGVFCSVSSSAVEPSSDCSA